MTTRTSARGGRAWRIGAGAVALLALVAVTWVWLQPESSRPRAAAQPSRPESVERAAHEPAQAPSITAASAAREEATAAVESAPRDASEPAEQRVVLRGKIESSRADLELAELTVARDPELDRWNIGTDVALDRRLRDVRRPPSRKASVAADGSFEVDLTGLWGVELALTATARHPHLRTVSLGLTSLGSVVRPKTDNLVELWLVVPMSEPACRVRGRVDFAGDERVDAFVAAFAVRGDELTVAAGRERAVDAAGEFELEIAQGLEHVLLCWAERWRPASLRIACAGDAPLELSPILLDRGFAISGQVLLGSEPFGADATVQASVERSLAMLVIGRSVFAWCGDGFEWATVSARANRIGLYELPTLGPRRYSIELLHIGDMFVTDVEPLRIDAPATDADFAPHVCELRLYFFANAQPRATHFQVVERTSIGQSSSGYTSDELGRATVWTSGRHPTEVIARDASGGERKFAVLGCAPGEVVEMRIDL